MVGFLSDSVLKIGVIPCVLYWTIFLRRLSTIYGRTECKPKKKMRM